jgi:hypothetical protein
MVKKPWWSWTWQPRMFSIAPFSSPRHAFWSPTGPTSLSAADPFEEWYEPFQPTYHGPEQVSWLSLTDHSPLWTRNRRWKPTLPFDNCLWLHSCQGPFMVDLLDNFLNILKLFWLRQAISWHCYDGDGGGGEGVRGERWTADRLQPIRWGLGGKGLKQMYLQIESTIKNIFNHKTSLPT